jgi:predicted dehydrogenase
MDRRKFIQYSNAALLTTWNASAAATTIRTGMLGTGHSHYGGKLKALKESPDYEVAAIAELNDGARTQELLKDPSIQLIVVECRAWEAVPWGRKVIDAGKHLHLEKPPGNDWAAFRELMSEARRKNLRVQLGYLWRWHEGVMAALDAAQKGWLGQVFMVRGTMNSDRGPEEREIEGHYKGGGMFELSGHVIDRIVELLGRPKAVKSWLRHDTKVADNLADNNLAVFEYDSALAVVTQSAQMSGAGDHRSFEILGTDGSFVLTPESNPPRMRVNVRTARGPYKAGWQEIVLPPQPRFIADFKELSRALKSGQPLKHSYDHELLLQETLLRAAGEIS